MERERPNAPYPPDFKNEAVKQYHQTGKTLREVAHDLGVSTNALREWIKRADNTAGTRESFTKDDQEELEHLRRENKTLREEREVLMKAAVLFAEESDR